jgi:hypothetical protein
MNDLATPQAAPGTVLPYNLITDVGGAVDPNATTGVHELIASQPQSAVYFSLTNMYEQPMTFNQMGIMAGPLKTPTGGSNTPGVVTLSLWSLILGYADNPTLEAQVTVDLTNATPGEFVWSAPLPTPFIIYGQIGADWEHPIWNIDVSAPSNYWVYSNRPCTMRNGNTWGSSSDVNNVPENDHLCLFGGVDLNLTSYRDLGTGSLSPDVSFSAILKRQSGLGPVKLAPHIGLTGHLRRVGVFDGGNDLEPSIVLNSTLAGGPLWKPSKLCTG